VRRDFDRASLIAGLAVTVLGILLLLDQLGVIDIGFGYAAPAVTATVGAVLLSLGLDVSSPEQDGAAKRPEVRTRKPNP
jgi:small-conductance mechanosensitive channel